MPSTATSPSLSTRSAMSLPRISQTPTQYRIPRRMSTSASVPGSLTASVYQIYPAYLPPAPDIPCRVNPLNPPPPKTRTVGLETIDPHWNNDQRTARLKERDYFRYHNAWSKYYYGTKAELEQYNSGIRSTLKQQMTDKLTRQKTHFLENFKESKEALNHDRRCREEDSTKQTERYVAMTSYRDTNRDMMDAARDARQRHKTQVDLFDREQMRYNPINWSMTLK